MFEKVTKKKVSFAGSNADLDNQVIIKINSDLKYSSKMIFDDSYASFDNIDSQYRYMDISDRSINDEKFSYIEIFEQFGSSVLPSFD